MNDLSERQFKFDASIHFSAIWQHYHDSIGLIIQLHLFRQTRPPAESRVKSLSFFSFNKLRSIPVFNVSHWQIGYVGLRQDNKATCSLA